LNIIAQCFLSVAVRHNGTFINGGILDKYYKFKTWGKIGRTCCLVAVIVFTADKLYCSWSSNETCNCNTVLAQEKGASATGKWHISRPKGGDGGQTSQRSGQLSSTISNFNAMHSVCIGITFYLQGSF
jgi:hypothetical protein